MTGCSADLEVCGFPLSHVSIMHRASADDLPPSYQINSFTKLGGINTSTWPSARIE
jgi:hypothetical protein